MIGAVIVSFFPDDGFKLLCQSLGQEFDYLVIVDNASDGRSVEALAEIEAGNYGNLVRLPRNLGIGAALNVGVNACIEKGCDWVATFDQDSELSAGFREAVVSEIKVSGRNKKRVGMLSSSFADGGVLYQNESGYVREAITSGSVIYAQAFKEVGGFDSSMFIDYVDHDMVLRILSAGFYILRIPGARINHSIGSGRPICFMNKRLFTVSNHSPGRVFTIYRNCIVTARRHWRRHFFWVAKSLIKEFFRYIKIIFFEEQKFRKSVSCLRGVVAGITANSEDSVSAEEFMKYSGKARF